MASSNLTISVYDPDTLQRVGILSAWISLVWEEAYQGVGLLQLEVGETAALAALLSQGRYVGLSGRNTLMVIHTIRVRNRKLIAVGSAALSVLALRALGGEIPAGTDGETVIRDMVGDMTPWPRLSLGGEAGLTDKTTSEITGADVLSLSLAVASQIDAGLRVRHDAAAKSLLFEVYKPALSGTKYSPLYGNLPAYERTLSNQSYRNVAIVAGEAQEDGTRPVVVVGNTAAAGAARREMYVDASDLWRDEDETDDAYRARLSARGEEELLAAAQADNITLTVLDESAQLGELLPVYIPDIGVRATVRIIGIRITAQRGQTTREITCGTPTITRRL